MFSFLKKTDDKKVLLREKALVYNVPAEQLSELKIKNADGIAMFKQMQDDMQKLLLIGEMDLFTKTTGKGAMKIIEDQLSAALVPKYETSFLNIIGSIRFIRSSSSNHKYDKTAIQVFEAMVQSDANGDFYDQLIEVLSSLDFHEPILSKEDIQDMAIDGHRMAERINENILEEGPDTQAQILKLQANMTVVKQVQVFFKMIQDLEKLHLFIYN